MPADQLYVGHPVELRCTERDSLRSLYVREELQTTFGTASEMLYLKCELRIHLASSNRTSVC